MIEHEGLFDVAMDIIEKAAEFSRAHHGTAVRKFTSEPYFFHPRDVAERISGLILEDSGIVDLFSRVKLDAMIAAAYLHDLVEDTDVTLRQIEGEFGVEIAGLVSELTSDREEIRMMGKAEYLVQKLDSMSVEARVIKLADREDNITGLDKLLTGVNAGWAIRYADQTRYILDNTSFVPTKVEAILIDSMRAILGRFDKLLNA
ncbi:MAG: HD domain-containing protein [Promethearchaeota archaeon]